MIYSQTLLKVADNSGARTVKCIKVLGGFKRKYAVTGDIIIVAVQKLRNRFKETSKVRRKQICKALVIRTKIKVRTKSGFCSNFNENAVALINKKGNPVGTRILGPVSRILIEKRFQRFISISAGVA